MFNIALYQPEIPPNTGNIIRLAANTGCTLHLIHPLGFGWDDKQLRRAGLDYHEFSRIIHHENVESFISQYGSYRMFACTTKAQRFYTDYAYQKEDIFLFGPETRGLPDDIRNNLSYQIKIPMLAHSRSLNLSNAVAVIVYEALRQVGFG